MIRNIGSNWLLTGLSIIATVGLLPFTLHALGDTQYGTWLLIASMTSYLSMLSLGVPAATVRFVAASAASNDVDRLNRTIGSSAALYLVMGLLSAIVGVGLFVVFESLYEIPVEHITSARWAYALVVLNISASFVAQLPYGIMTAYHAFTLRNAVQMSSLLIRVGLTLALLSWKPDFIWLAVIQFVIFLFEFVVAIRIVRRRWPQLHLGLRHFDRNMVREILGFSLYVMILNIGGQLVFQTDALVIGAFMPIEAVPRFSIPSSLTVYLMQFFMGIGAVVMPMAASLHARGESTELRNIFLKWSKITVSLTFVSGIFLLVMGPAFIGWWIGPHFVLDAGLVLQILTVGNLLFLPARGVALPFLLGMGKPRATAVIFLAVGLLNLAMSIALVRTMGLVGVAIGTTVPNLIFAVATVGLALREAKVSLGEYVTYCFSRTVLISLPLALLLYWYSRFAGAGTLLGLLVAGLLCTGLFAALSVAWVYNRDPRIDLEALLRERIAAGRAS